MSCNAGPRNSSCHFCLASCKPAHIVDPKPSASQLVPCSPRHSATARVSHSYLDDCHCYPAVAALYEPQSFYEHCSDPFWQKAIEEKL